MPLRHRHAEAACLRLTAALHRRTGGRVPRRRNGGGATGEGRRREDAGTASLVTCAGCLPYYTTYHCLLHACLQRPACLPSASLLLHSGERCSFACTVWSLPSFCVCCHCGGMLAWFPDGVKLFILKPIICRDIQTPVLYPLLRHIATVNRHVAFAALLLFHGAVVARATYARQPSFTHITLYYLHLRPPRPTFACCLRCYLLCCCSHSSPARLTALLPFIRRLNTFCFALGDGDVVLQRRASCFLRERLLRCSTAPSRVRRKTLNAQHPYIHPALPRKATLPTPQD